MSDIRKLTAEAATDSGDRPSREWSRSQGVMFIGGVALLIIGLGGLLYCWYAYQKLDLSYDLAAQTVVHQESVDSTALGLLYEEWTLARDEGLLPMATPQHIRHQRRAVALTRGAYFAGLLVVVGIGLAVVACVASLKPVTPPSR